MEDAGRLSLKHPYVEKPGKSSGLSWCKLSSLISQSADCCPTPAAAPPAGAKQMCTWAACFGLGAIVGLFCMSPDAGDYGVWQAEAQQLVDRWAPGFAQAGCTLSLQRHRCVGGAGRGGAGCHWRTLLLPTLPSLPPCRDFWLDISLNPAFNPGQPVAPPLPAAVQQWQAQQPAAAPADGQAAPALPAPPAQPPVADKPTQAGYAAV